MYDAIAPHFSATRYRPWPHVDRFVDSLPVGALLFDIGCGNGRYMNGDRSIVHVGIDRSIGLLNQCVQLDRRREVQLGSALVLPYRDNVADAAMSIAVIHHFSVEESLIIVRKKMFTHHLRF